MQKRNLWQEVLYWVLLAAPVGVFALALGVDQQTAPAALDPGNGGTGLDADAERLEPGRQPAHQVGIEVRQEPLGPL